MMPLILVAYRPENKLTRRKDTIAMHAKPWPLLSMPNTSKMESGERKTKHHSYPTQITTCTTWPHSDVEAMDRRSRLLVAL